MILLKQINLVYLKKFFSTCTRNSTQYLRSLVKYETKFSILESTQWMEEKCAKMPPTGSKLTEALKTWQTSLSKFAY